MINWIETEPEMEINLWVTPKGQHCFVVSGVDDPDPRPVIKGVLSRNGFFQRKVEGRTLFAAFINAKTTKALQSIPGARVVKRERADVYIKTLNEAVGRFNRPKVTQEEAIIEREEKLGAREFEQSEMPVSRWYPLEDEYHYGTFDRDTFKPAQRAQDNLNAIKILKGGGAKTLADQTVLAQYVGWGGLQAVFDERDNTPLWAKNAGNTLRGYVANNVLTEQEYSDMRASILNSHYTDLSVIEGIWQGLSDGGFEGGDIAELGAGVGHFIGLTPVDIAAKSTYTAVEKEPIAADLIAELYPAVSLEATALEITPLKDGGSDLIIGNVPFADIKVPEEIMGAKNLSLHNYFIARAIQAVKPGGTVAVLTSTFTLDGRDSEFRELIYQRASLAGAVRLPASTMLGMAGTDVSMDLLIFKKRESDLDPRQMKKNHPEWVDSPMAIPESLLSNSEQYDNNIYTVNGIFIDNELKETQDSEQLDPKPVVEALGEFTIKSGAYGPVLSLLPTLDKKALSKAISDTVSRATGTAFGSQLVLGSDLDNDDKVIYLELDQRQESISRLFDDSFYMPDEFGGIAKIVTVIEDGVSRKRGVDAGLKGKPLSRVFGMVMIRDLMFDTLAYQRKGEYELAAEARKTLNHHYDVFVKQNGFLTDAVNQRVFSSDPSAGRLLSLERMSLEEDDPIKSDIFNKDIIAPPVEVESVDTLQEGVAVSLHRLGHIDIAFIAELLNSNASEVAVGLIDDKLAYPDPNDHSQYIQSSVLLSGDVKTQLDDVNRAIASEKDAGRSAWQWNGLVEAIEAVIPADIAESDLHARFGSTWLPNEWFGQFLEDTYNGVDASYIDVEQSSFSKEWTISASKSGNWYQTERAINDNFAVSKIQGRQLKGYDLLERILNGQSLTVKYTRTEGDSKVTVTDEAATALAEDKATELQDKFTHWLFKADQVRSDEAVKLYNNLFNRTVDRSFDGSHLVFPGMASDFVLRAHQKNAVWRNLSVAGNTLLAHEVGTGKTAVMIATAIESNRLGQSARAVMIVPNSMLRQIHREASVIYPEANILAVSNNDLKTANRSRFIGKMVNNEWDLVVMTHAMFNRINVDPAFEYEWAKGESDRLTALLLDDDIDSKSMKQIESSKAKADAKIANYNSSEDNTEKGVHFGDLGVDLLIVDEFHNYKNLEIPEYDGRGGPQAINGSQRAWSMNMKLQSLYEKRGSVSGVIAASGTPVSNNVLEFFVLQRYLQPDLLEKAGLSNFNEWRSTFLQEVTRWEPSPSGKGFTPKQRFVLQGVPEMMSLLRQTMDVVAADDTDIERPDMATVNISIPMTDLQEQCMEELADRVDLMQTTKVDPRDDNILKVISDGIKLSLSAELWGLAEPGYTKIDAVADNVSKLYHEHALTSSTQLVFLDLGVPGGSTEFNAYQAITDKLVEQGLVREDIAFIHDAKTDKAREILFAKVRDGDIRVLIGSTSKMGEGVNVQDRLCGLHHVDAPWRPSDIEQRDGRMQRQGNIHKNVARYIYTVKDTFDVFRWSVLKNKAEIFVAALRGDPTVRVLDMEGVDMSFAETAALTTGNPYIKEKLELETSITKLNALFKAHEREYRDNESALVFCNKSIKEATARMLVISDIHGRVVEPIYHTVIKTSRLKSIDDYEEDVIHWTADFSDHIAQKEEQSKDDYHQSVHFDGDRNKLLSVLSGIFKAQKETGDLAPVTVKYRGIIVNVDLVKIDIDEGGKDDLFTPTLRQWRIQYDGGSVDFKGGAAVETFIDNTKEELKRLAERIISSESRVKEIASWKVSRSTFSKGDDLAQARGRLKELDEFIEKGMKPDSNNKKGEHDDGYHDNDQSEGYVINDDNIERVADEDEKESELGL